MVGLLDDYVFLSRMEYQCHCLHTIKLLERNVRESITSERFIIGQLTSKSVEGAHALGGCRGGLYKKAYKTQTLGM